MGWRVLGTVALVAILGAGVAGVGGSAGPLHRRVRDVAVSGIGGQQGQLGRLAATETAGARSPGEARAAGVCPGMVVEEGAAHRLFQWPLTGVIGIARAFDGPAMPWLAGHRGVDLAAPAGTPVIAPAGGVVSFAGFVVDRHLIVIDHGTLRSTLEPVMPAFSVGAAVSAGQTVGTVSGEASHSPATVHWGVRRGDTYLDPTLLVCPPPRAVLLE
jgi:murein DD-endopeptidase MepM/ murein hydrolase activator NlpD